jgi:hypothetical protein
MTSRAALQRFFERLTPRFEDEPAPAPRTLTERKRASRRAAEELSPGKAVSRGQ